MELTFLNSKNDIAIFYVIVTALFLTIHIVWDYRSEKTPPFDLRNLKAKVPVVFSAVTFCSSFLLLAALLDRNIFPLLGDSIVPVLVSGSAGILISLADLSP